jgi:holo-ACP synthase CitX
MPVLCGKINYPGNNKINVETKLAFKILTQLLNKYFNVYTVEAMITYGFDGAAYVMVLDMNALDAKKAAVDIEEYSELGRVFDIDIYDKEYPIGRTDIGMKPRSCILCDEEARVCSKLGKHTLNEVLQAFDELIHTSISMKNYF